MDAEKTKMEKRKKDYHAIAIVIADSAQPLL